MSTAALNYHSAFREQAIKFQDWDSFFPESSGPLFIAGVRGSFDDMFEGTSKHCRTETQKSD